MVKNRKRKRRLNPIYWVFQGIFGLFALSACFWIPALVCKILGG
uniref:FUMARATE REDUCTASE FLAVOPROTEIN n=1 Tax=Siphoviridae sp. ctKcB20 TaxID=2827568 RepID=A0A8S5LKW7_9CAUD|nr:MAG TPA: FUMARATE REDUCTASE FLAVOPROTEIN [Siphoviridae sp. ctKcB20]